MEVLKQMLFAIALLFSTFCVADSTDHKGFVLLQKAILNPDSANFIHLPADSASLDLFHQKVKDFAHIRGLVVIGEVEEPQLLWQALREIELLEFLFLFDNNLEEVQIGGTTSTLKYLWIRNSPYLNAQSLNIFLQRSNLLTSLRLDGIELNQAPREIANMPILSELQISNSTIDFESLVGYFGKKNKLKRLILADNNFQFISKGFKKFSSLAYLDLSGNNLTEDIPQLKHLESLDTFIVNRNSFDEVERLSRQIQALNVSYLTFDPQTSELQNNIAYLLPGKEIIWGKLIHPSQKLVLPSFSTGNKSFQKVVPNRKVKKQSLKKYESNGETRLLSSAYLEYDRLVFPQPLKNFDTSSFTTRFLDSSYVYVEKIEIQNHTKYDEKYKLKYSRAYGGVKKDKKTTKIDHLEDSHVLFDIEKELSCSDGDLIQIDFNQIKEHKRSDLKPFQQFTWLIDLDITTFSEQFITQKAWSDIRFYYKDGTFTIVLKGRFAEDEFTAEVRYKRNPNDLKDLEKNAKKAFERYEKTLQKEEVRFDNFLNRAISKEIRPVKSELAILWAKVEAKMSEEEKAMTQEQWLEYYTNIKAEEFGLLQNSELNLAYLARYMVGQGFKEKRSNDFYVGQKWIEANLVHGGDTLAIKQFCLVDLDQKVASTIEVKANNVLLEPFHDLFIFGETSKGEIFQLNSNQISQLFDGKAIVLESYNWLASGRTTARFFEEKIYPNLRY